MHHWTLAEIRKRVRAIHVSALGYATALKPQPTDARYERHPYSDDFTEGQGTEKCPFTYLSAAPVSPHYAVIDLWLKFRSHAATRPTYIEVNDWILKLESAGVRAQNGRFTQLAPN